MSAIMTVTNFNTCNSKSANNSKSCVNVHITSEIGLTQIDESMAIPQAEGVARSVILHTMYNLANLLKN